MGGSRLNAALVKTVAIAQSSYVPWKGYFDLINLADEFVLLDDVQFTRRDWRNRNRIKTAQGLLWLTIPVEVKGKYRQTIAETRVADPGWATRHLKSLRHAYGRAPYYTAYEARFDSWYDAASGETSLSAINRIFVDGLCEVLRIDSRISASDEYELDDEPTARLVSICRQAGAGRYVSGPSARAYLDEEAFRRHGIEVVYMDYAGYPEYPQLHPPFEHAVSVVDLLVNTGASAQLFLKSF